jgi:hypothetical protein
MDLSEEIRSAAWDEDFPSDADAAFRKAVEPTILDIEEAVQANSSLGALATRLFRPGSVVAGLTLMLGTVAELPDVAALALGSGTTFAMTARGAYNEWRASRDKIESNQMYFYYSARERLANLDSAPTPGLSLAGLGVQLPVSEADGAADVSDSETQSDVERRAQEFMEENEVLLDKDGYATLQRVVIQGSHVGTELADKVTEAANRYAAANRAFAEAMRNTSTRPLKIYELEGDVEWLKPIYEHQNGLHEELSAFMARVASAYEREGGELSPK